MAICLFACMFLFFSDMGSVSINFRMLSGKECGTSKNELLISVPSRQGY